MRDSQKRSLEKKQAAPYNSCEKIEEELAKKFTLGDAHPLGGQGRRKLNRKAEQLQRETRQKEGEKRRSQGAKGDENGEGELWDGPDQLWVCREGRSWE